jgi:hypothetical protein
MISHENDSNAQKQGNEIGQTKEEHPIIRERERGKGSCKEATEAGSPAASRRRAI